MNDTPLNAYDSIDILFFLVQEHTFTFIALLVITILMYEWIKTLINVFWFREFPK
jgi:hypothetical protein